MFPDQGLKRSGTVQLPRIDGEATEACIRLSVFIIDVNICLNNRKLNMDDRQRIFVVPKTTRCQMTITRDAGLALWISPAILEQKCFRDDF